MMTSRTGPGVWGCPPEEIVMCLQSPPTAYLLAHREQQHAGDRERSTEDQPGGPRAAREVDVDQPEDADRGQDSDGADEEENEQTGDDVADDALGGDDRLVPRRDHGVLDLVGYLIGPIRHERSLHTPLASPLPRPGVLRCRAMARLVDPQSPVMPA